MFEVAGEMVDNTASVIIGAEMEGVEATMKVVALDLEVKIE